MVKMLAFGKIVGLIISKVIISLLWLSCSKNNQYKLFNTGLKLRTRTTLALCICPNSGEMCKSMQESQYHLWADAIFAYTCWQKHLDLLVFSIMAFSIIFLHRAIFYMDIPVVLGMQAKMIW